MRRTLRAIYENGAFRPLGRQEVGLNEGQEVRLTVDTAEPAKNALELARRVYADLSDSDIDEVEQIALSRSVFFNGRDPIP